MTSLIAIGAGIAALTGIGAGIGIGLATSKATDAIASCCNFNYLILRLRKGSGRECNY